MYTGCGGLPALPVCTQPGVAVKITVTNGKAKISPPLKLHIEQRLALAFGRFADRIRHVTVKFTKGKKVKDSPVTLCGIEVSLHKKLRVEAANADPFAAADLAVDHAVRAIARVLENEL